MTTQTCPKPICHNCQRPLHIWANVKIGLIHIQCSVCEPYGEGETEAKAYEDYQGKYEAWNEQNEQKKYERST